MRVMAQMAMVMNLDKCIGCHTCSVTCKQVWTNRPGHGVRVLQQRRDQARHRLPPPLRGPGAVEGRLDAGPQGAPAAEGAAAGCGGCCPSSTTPTCRRSTTTATRGPTTTRR